MSYDKFYEELINIWKTGGKDGGEGGLGTVLLRNFFKDYKRKQF